MSTQRFKRGLSAASHLFKGLPVWTCLQQFRVDFTVEDPSTLEWLGNVNLRHRGPELSPVFLGPIGFGIRATLRYDQHSHANMPSVPSSSVDQAYYNSSLAFILHDGKAAGNIASYDHHYANAITHGVKDLQNAGCYRLEFWGNSHTVSPNIDGLIAINTNGNSSDISNPYSVLNVKVTSGMG